MIVICNSPGAIYVIGLVGRMGDARKVIVGFQNKKKKSKYKFEMKWTLYLIIFILHLTIRFKQ